MTEIFMPKAGMDMKEGKLIRWLKNVGDPVELDEPIMEIETDKITMEAEAPATGILLAKLIEDGTTVPVLQTIGWIGQPGEKVPDGPGPSGVETAPDQTETAESGPVPSSVAVKEADKNESGTVPTQPPVSTAGPPDGYIPASPLARKLARENGISLSEVSVPGPVKADDVLRFVKEHRSAHGLSTDPGDRMPKHIPLTPIRKAIARNMFQSLHSMAQTSDSVEVDVTELMNIKKALQACSSQLGIRISVNDLLSYAAVKMVQKHPLANASFAETEVIVYPFVNLCTAVATDHGLTSPVVHDADQMGLLELSAALHDITDRARNQKLTTDDLRDGTFTLTNMGVFPVDNFNPILPSPQSCILGFGRCTEKPAVHNGQICIRTRMVLSVTYDHRVFDGGEVGAIMRTMKEYLEEPASFLSL